MEQSFHEIETIIDKNGIHRQWSGEKRVSVLVYTNEVDKVFFEG